MIRLVSDAVVALLRVAANLTPLDVLRRPHSLPFAGEAATQPAGAEDSPSSAGTGGHPIRPTSELLSEGAMRLCLDTRHTDDDAELARAMWDRAANLAAFGD